MHSRLICQDKNLFLGSSAYLHGPAKPAQPSNQQCHLEILQLKCPNPVKHRLCYDSLQYISPLVSGGAVNAAEEVDNLMN